MQDFNGKTIVVTGGTGGLGGEICKEFNNHECNLVILDLDDEKLQNFRMKLENESGAKSKIFTYKVDVSNENEVQEVYSTLLDEVMKIDILINNAGYIHYNNVFELTSDKWDQILNVNLKGMFLITKYFARSMKENMQGKIINMSSVAAVSGIFGGAAYTSSKSGILGLTKVLAKELSEYNINVNSIAPGPIDGDFLNENSDDSGRQMRIEKTLFKRIANYEDIVKPVLFFASSDSDWITGQNLFVDGGYTIQ